MPMTINQFRQLAAYNRCELKLNESGVVSEPSRCRSGSDRAHVRRDVVIGVKFVSTLEVGPVMVFLASKRGRFLELDFRNVGVIPAKVLIVVELAPGERMSRVARLAE